MSKLTLEDAISHCLETAEQLEERANIPYKVEDSELQDNACRECAADHRQLAEWLTELKQWRRVYGICPSYEMCIPECKEGYDAQIAEHKRLLKMAVSIINNSFPEVGSCWGCANHDEVNDECKGGAFAECADVCKWQYAEEALKLIGCSENG